MTLSTSPYVASEPNAYITTPSDNPNLAPEAVPSQADLIGPFGNPPAVAGPKDKFVRFKEAVERHQRMIFLFVHPSLSIADSRVEVKQQDADHVVLIDKILWPKALCPSELGETDFRFNLYIQKGDLSAEMAIDNEFCADRPAFSAANAAKSVGFVALNALCWPGPLMLELDWSESRG